MKYYTDSILHKICIEDASPKNVFDSVAEAISKGHYVVSVVCDGDEIFKVDGFNDKSVYNDCYNGWTKYCIENGVWDDFEKAYYLDKYGETLDDNLIKSLYPEISVNIIPLRSLHKIYCSI